MIYIPTNIKISVEWFVKKGIGNEAEDFSRSIVKLFVFSQQNRWAVSCTADYTGLVKAELPENLPEGVYSLELLWIKNDGSINGSRCLQRTRKPSVFTIDASAASVDTSTTLVDQSMLPLQSEAGQPATIKMTTIAAPYGYDGMSAYEIAVLRGATTLDEENWSKGLFDDVLAGVLDELVEGVQVLQEEVAETTGRFEIKLNALTNPAIPLRADGKGQLSLSIGKGLKIVGSQLCVDLSTIDWKEIAWV